MTPVGFESFSKMANDIASQVTAEKYRSKLPCAPKDPKTQDDACARKILSHYGLLLSVARSPRLNSITASACRAA